MLSKFRRAFHYSLPDLSAILGLWALLAAAEIYVKLSPAAGVIARLKKNSVKETAPAPEKFKRVLELLEIADRQGGFRPHCLRKAVALKWLADFARVPTEFKIGVARDSKGMHAHGWLECNGRRLESRAAGLPFEELAGA